jgi:membrane-associated protease RseP (regulator of RpoE activity)
MTPASRTPIVLGVFVVLILAVGGLAVLRRPPKPTDVAEPPVLRLSPDEWRVSKRLKDEYLASDRVHREIRLKPQTGRTSEEVVSLTIDSIDERSPMYAAGFRKGDLILEVNGSPVTTLKRAVGLIQEVRAGSFLTARLQRDGKIVNFRCDFP